MRNIELFHKIEEEHKLFDLKSKELPQIWDVLRVSIYNNFILGQIKYNIIYHRDFNVIINSIIYSIKSLSTLGQGKNLFFISSRDVDSEGFWYDKISKQLIDLCPPNERIVIELNSFCGQSRFKKINYCLISVLRKGIVKRYQIPMKSWNIINNSFKDISCEKLDKTMLDTKYSSFIKNEKIIRFFLRILRPKQIFVSCDCQKEIYSAAQKLHIKTYEMQHAGIVFDYPSYSYPSSITELSNIIYADYYLKLGSQWGTGMNIPCKQLVIGNDLLSPINNDSQESKNVILFISNTIHRNALMPICREFAQKYDNIKIIYKLHPDEFSLKNDTEKYFNNINHVSVYTNEYPMNKLIYLSKVVVLIYSSTFFEAISRNRTVAVLKTSNSYIISDYVYSIKNASYISNINDLYQLYLKEPTTENINFYDKFNKTFAESIIQ